MSYLRTADAWADGVKQTLNPDGTNAGFNVGANAADPSILVNGDVWYQSTANELRARINGATVALVASVSPPFTDTNALVKGSADATKLLRFEVDGFTTATTRVLTPPNADITLAGINIAQTFSQTQSLDDAVALRWLTRTTLTSPSDGVLRLTNNAQTGFNRLQLGGTTSAFPAIGHDAVSGGPSLEIFGADGNGPGGLLVYQIKTTNSDFERLHLGFDGADAIIWTEAGSTGTGINRDLVLGAAATERLRILAGGTITWGGNASSLDTDGSLNLAVGSLFSANVTAGLVTIPGVFQADVGGITLGFFNAATVVQQDVIPLTNSVTPGGTADQLDDFAGAVYATDATTIRDDIYQLGEKVNQIITALEAYGLLTP